MKKVAMILLLMGMAFSTTGCWNYRELESINIVAGVAIDQGSGSSGYHLTFETVDTSGKGEGDGSIGGQGIATISSQIIETDGNTVFDAVRNALKVSDKKLYFGDCKVVIISHQLAEKGISPVLDWLNRDSEPRLTTGLFISKENTAADIIRPKHLSEPITSYAISTLITDDSKYLSKAPYMQVYKVSDVLGGEGESLFLPVLSIDNQNQNVPALDGTAVFKKDKLLGFLNSEESKYLLFIKNMVNGGLLLTDENSPMPNITLEIKKSRTNVSAVMAGETPKIAIQVRTEVDLAEMQSSTDFDTENGIQKVKADAGKTLEENIRQLISKVQNEYDSDIFGFGNSIYQNDTTRWNEIKPKWDKLFKTLDVAIFTDVQIKNTAKIKSNVRVAG